MDDAELLDIAQAAAFLRVSATSLRRWTNAGRLPCYRVGGRRERRFLRADLLRFLERVGPPPPVSPVPAQHLCGLYLDATMREQQAVAFLADELGRGTVCLLVAEPRVRGRVLARLARRRPAVRDDLAAGRIALGAYQPAANAQLAFWKARFTSALRAGATALGVVADVSGGRLARRPFDEVLEYERRYDRLSRGFPVTTLCLYDARRLTGVLASRTLHVHEGVFAQPAGATGGGRRQPEL
jgi:excisionase family DNA binding protein